jgi:hypothetical protein
VSGIQLNQAVALARFAVGIASSLIIETLGENNVFSHNFQIIEIRMILVTGCLAVMNNTVGFSLIGRAGAITFQVVGHVKTMTVFVFGLMMFTVIEEKVEKRRKKIAGLCLSMVSVVLYTIFEIRNKNAAQATRPAVEEDEDPKKTTAFETARL